MNTYSVVENGVARQVSGEEARQLAILETVPTPRASEIPTPSLSVTRRQLKEWLIDHDKLDAVEAVMNAIENAKERRKALNWWTEATDFLRDHPLVSQLGVALGMTENQIDAAFKEAAAL